MVRLVVISTWLFFAVWNTAWSQEKSVSIGYLATYTPWTVAIAEGQFERATGYRIRWREFTTGLQAITALASNEVQITYAGVTPIAGAASSGVDLEVFWIIADISHSEALVVRRGSNIVAPQDLRGKRIAAPIGSTTHYHLLFALSQFQIPRSQVTILNLNPNEIAKAWEDGSIDAAFIWEPTLGELIRRGEVLVDSGQLGKWGRPTFDALIAKPNWAEANPEFMRAFVKTLAEVDNSYRRNPGAWNRSSRPIEEMVAIVGGTRARAERTLRAYDFPSLREQESRKWLGGGNVGGAAAALRDNADFLMNQDLLKQVVPTYGQFINPEWARRARGQSLGRP